MNWIQVKAFIGFQHGILIKEPVFMGPSSLRPALFDKLIMFSFNVKC